MRPMVFVRHATCDARRTTCDTRVLQRLLRVTDELGRYKMQFGPMPAAAATTMTASEGLSQLLGSASPPLPPGWPDIVKGLAELDRAGGGGGDVVPSSRRPVGPPLARLDNVTGMVTDGRDATDGKENRQPTAE